jgi:peroxiredoxin
VTNNPQNSFLNLPDDLPEPTDDGSANHLLGMTIPNISLKSTSGSIVKLDNLKGKIVIFCYPMTGVPGVALPDGWDEIPGARGCTPQVCSYRDKFSVLEKLSTKVFGVSTQNFEYQKELHDRLELPYEILSDSELKFQASVNLPVFTIENKVLLKRITLIVEEGIISKVHYPVFPSNKDVDWVIEELSK